MASRTERNRDVMKALRERHAGNEWAWFEEVPDGTGQSARRRADGVAMNMWPSRGLELHGFEVKVDRKDWRDEKEHPEKAEAVARFCDRWWLVIDDLKIIEGHDVPLVWGILVVANGKIVTHREAAKLEPQALTRSMVASLLRRASDARDDGLKAMVRREDVDAEVARRLALDAERMLRDNDPEGLRKEVARWREWGEKIHDATGIRGPFDYQIPNLKAAAKALEHHDPCGALDRYAELVAECATKMRKAAKALRADPLFADKTRPDAE